MASKSRPHFSHLFHAMLGMPLREYVRTVRLERAYRLLLTTPLSLTAIAAEAGSTTCRTSTRPSVTGWA